MQAGFFQGPKIAGLGADHLARQQDVTHAVLALDANGSNADGYIVKRKSGHPAHLLGPESYVNKTGTSSRCRMRSQMFKPTTR